LSLSVQSRPIPLADFDASSVHGIPRFRGVPTVRIGVAARSRSLNSPRMPSAAAAVGCAAAAEYIAPAAAAPLCT
jgi:hypothetical protein